jgi:2',3'-cyclic-nucleotide 2'-phosphodiesterase/3'-nucleotidase
MNAIRFYISVFLIIFLISCSGKKDISVTVVATTDIHGTILPFDYTEGTEAATSLASVAGYLKDNFTDRSSVVLLDNGDNLQGQPAVYYYNFIDTVSPHLLSEAFNLLGYDAVSVGNHDIEAGHQVYDRIRKEYDFDMLAANAVDITTGEPYFKPYTILKKKGLKIAVLGLTTPYIPNWLPPQLYSGMKFADMTETAEKWMKEISGKKPDLIIGLFHSGWDKRRMTDDKEEMAENGSASVAYNVRGFDLIINGHDHSLANEKIVNRFGDTVLILDGGSSNRNLMRADIKLRKNGKRIEGRLIDLKEVKPDESFKEYFAKRHEILKDYTGQVIGESKRELSSREAYFGPSAFMSMIHTLQLEISDADISFAAPLSFDATISKGPVTVGDMFRLYRYENMLYTMSLTGKEIKDYLEHSYGLWINTVKEKGDNLLLLRKDKAGNLLMNDGRARLANPPYNFDSAEGINYTVDVTKETGSRISVSSFTDGRPFDMNGKYLVAINSYRGSGGGGHLTEGAGLDSEQIKERLVSSTVKDLRYYMIELISKRKVFDPTVTDNWKFIPVELAERSRTKEYDLLFNKKQ